MTFNVFGVFLFLSTSTTQTRSNVFFLNVGYVTTIFAWPYKRYTRAYSKEFFGVHNFSGSSPPLRSRAPESSYGVWGSAVSSSSGVWDETPGDNDFGAI